MNRREMDRFFNIALQQGEGDYLWKKLHEVRRSSPDRSGLFENPQLLREMDRFLDQNRLSVSSAHSRYALGRMVAKIKAALFQQPVAAVSHSVPTAYAPRSAIHATRHRYGC